MSIIITLKKIFVFQRQPRFGLQLLAPCAVVFTENHEFSLILCKILTLGVDL